MSGGIDSTVTALMLNEQGIARVAGLDVVQQPDAVRHSVGCVAQKSGVDINATRTREPDAARAVLRTARRRAQGARRPHARAIRARGGCGPRSTRLLGRHEAEARHRDGSDSHAARPVPRRADDGTRSGGARGLVDRDLASLGERRHYRAADDALPRGGGPARAQARRSSIAAVSSPKARPTRSRASCRATRSRWIWRTRWRSRASARRSPEFPR